MRLIASLGNGCCESWEIERCGIRALGAVGKRVVFDLPLLIEDLLFHAQSMGSILKDKKWKFG